MTWPSPPGTAITEGPLSAEFPNLEVKSNGFIAAAPSLHPTGRAYRWREW